MLNANSSCAKWSMITLTLGLLTAFSISLSGQEAAKASPQGGSVVDDWSHHHVVFSNPGTREEAQKNGTLENWQAVTNSPRFKMQQLRRDAAARGLATGDPSVGSGLRDAAMTGRADAAFGPTTTTAVDPRWKAPNSSPRLHLYGDCRSCVPIGTSRSAIIETVIRPTTMAATSTVATRPSCALSWMTTTRRLATKRSLTHFSPTEFTG